MLPGLLDATARNSARGARRGAVRAGERVLRDDPQDDLREAALRFRMTGETGAQDIGGLMGVREAGRIGVVLAGTVRPAAGNVPEVGAGFFEARAWSSDGVRRSFRTSGKTFFASRTLGDGPGR